MFVPTRLVGIWWVFFVPSILADRYIHRREMWVVSLKSWSSVEFKITKDYFDFRCFRGVIEDWIFVWYLFTFSVIFLQIKSFSNWIVFQIEISFKKIYQLCVPYRLKAIKKTSSGLIGSFNIKSSKSIWELFFSKIFLFFLLQVT